MLTYEARVEQTETGLTVLFADAVYGCGEVGGDDSAVGIASDHLTVIPEHLRPIRDAINRYLEAHASL